MTPSVIAALPTVHRDSRDRRRGIGREPNTPLMVHEYVTDQPELAENDAALSTFIDTVFPKTTLPVKDFTGCIPM